MTTSDGVLFDERLVESGDLTGPYGARPVLANPGVDVAVLETARGGMMLRGVGYESNDASVLTNVSSDHMDLHGIHTLPELAEVKSVISRMTRPDGVVVLNADDDLVAAMARHVHGTGLAVLHACPARGASGGTSPVAAGDRRSTADSWSNARARSGGRSSPSAMSRPRCAAWLATTSPMRSRPRRGHGRWARPSTEVAPVCARFGPAREQAIAGRLNLYRRDETIVIVDFAHNEAGVERRARRRPGPGRRPARRGPASDR